MTLAPPLSPEMLDRLRAYRPPSARDIERMIAVRHLELRRERRRARIGLRVTLLAMPAAAAGAYLTTQPDVKGALGALVLLGMSICPFLVGPARAHGLKVRARRDVQDRFAPLDARQARTVLAFLHRHPEATQIIRGWRPVIGELRQYEFGLFEDVFRAGNRTAHRQEVADFLELAGDGRPVPGRRPTQGEVL
jgi:hypothetical protein